VTALHPELWDIEAMRAQLSAAYCPTCKCDTFPSRAGKCGGCLSQIVFRSAEEIAGQAEREQERKREYQRTHKDQINARRRALCREKAMA